MNWWISLNTFGTFREELFNIGHLVLFILLYFWIRKTNKKIEIVREMVKK